MDIGARFALFWKAFFNPEKVFEAEAKGKATMADGAINNVIAFLIIPILTTLLSLFGPRVDAMAGITIGLGLLVALVIFSLVVAALYHFIAMLLGGKGSLEKTYYLLSIINALAVFSYIALLVTYLVVIMVVSVAPISALVTLPVIMVVAYTVLAYLFYILGLAVKSAHGLSSLKGIFSFMVAVGIIFAVLLAILFLLVGAAVLGMLGGQQSAAAGGLPI